jgi:hypothetical protein
MFDDILKPDYFERQTYNPCICMTGIAHEQCESFKPSNDIFKCEYHQRTLFVNKDNITTYFSHCIKDM